MFQKKKRATEQQNNRTTEQQNNKTTKEDTVGLRTPGTKVPRQQKIKQNNKS